jgi:type IV pilus assembly protein PilV
VTGAPGVTRRGVAGGRAGLTIIEVVIAIIVLSVGLLALAGLGASASRTIRGGRDQTLAAAVAQSRFDSLASVPGAQLAVAAPTVGAAETRGVRERWVVTDDRNLKRVADTVRVPGRTRPLVYISVIPCRD